MYRLCHGGQHYSSSRFFFKPYFRVVWFLLECEITIFTSIFQELTLKVQRQQNVIYRTSIQQDSPWKLQQVQDAGNHLQHALQHIDSVDSDYAFRSSEEVLHLLGDILGCLQRGRTSLIVPRKRTIDDLMKSRNMVNGQLIFWEYVWLESVGVPLIILLKTLAEITYPRFA